MSPMPILPHSDSGSKARRQRVHIELEFVAACTGPNTEVLATEVLLASVPARSKVTVKVWFGKERYTKARSKVTVKVWLSEREVY